MCYTVHMTDITRFMSKVEKADSGCWLWLGSTKYSGYGSFYSNGKGIRAHRYSYEVFVKKIPFGLVIDHLCRNRACVNPDHLEAVSTYENVMRGQGVGANAKRRNSCARGHIYSKGTYWLREKNPGRLHRVCNICARDNMRRLRAKP